MRSAEVAVELAADVVPIVRRIEPRVHRRDERRNQPVQGAEVGTHIEPEKIAGYFLTGTLVAFGVGRFSSAALMRYVKPAFLMGVFNLRGTIVPLIDIAFTEGRRPGMLPKHVVVAALLGEGGQDLRVGIASDEVIGTYSAAAEALLDQAPAEVPHCRGLLRHDDRLALVVDLRRLTEVFPVPVI